MIVLLKGNTTPEELRQFTDDMCQLGLDPHVTVGEAHTIVGLVGDTSRLDIGQLEAMDIVEAVRRVQEPFKKANRRFQEEDTIIVLDNGTKIGGGNFQVIAGPCSIESEEQIIHVAQEVKKAGATLLRGGAFKPRTSPYAFQGLHTKGIRLLVQAKQATGLPIVTEIMDKSHLPLFDEVDVIQVGARNMQNFELLKHLGRTNKPILLKRGLANTLEELLMSAEYIMANGNERVLLCERGIRTFETYTRNTLDLSAIPVLRRLSHLPIIVDPSHATGDAGLVKPMALAATAAGADGLMIEVHNDPPHALCDGAQSLTPQGFQELVGMVQAIRPYSDCHAASEARL
ncbi:3-deoxy-7-phosphoheptulonate synthase [Hominifimenecus sp. rT4P-3]|uniref:3-deoxy-7-phosphoheptulonate synthase n=1 Tax=Hominifimenecus sp. rT4P-3 TaxID=3242979 RepID=UPI003DA1D91B